MNDVLAAVPSSADRTEAALRCALVDSRQRWHDLVAIAADIAYETDASARFVFVTPDPALGWSTATLIGQPAELLLAAGGSFNPFRIKAPVRRRLVWLQRADGGAALIAIAAAPLLDLGGTSSALVAWVWTGPNTTTLPAELPHHFGAARCWITYFGV